MVHKTKLRVLLVTVLSTIIIFNSNIIQATTDKIYNKIRLFTEVFTLIKNNYVEEVESKDLVYGAAKGMVSTLDNFSQFLEPEDYKDIKVKTEGAFGGLGIRISIKDEWLTVITPLPGTPAYKVGILPGDKIIKIEGETTKGTTLNDAVKKLRGKPGTKVNITVSREGEKEPIDFTITREKIKLESVVSRILKDNIAYIRVTEFSGKTVKDFDKAMHEVESKGAVALILDLRNNPGGLLNAAVDVTKCFLGEEKLIVYTQGRNKDQRVDFKANKEATHKYLPLVVLVNKGSASGSEIVAGALKDWKRGVLLGSQTFGKGSVQTVLKLSDSAGLRLTTAKYYTPSGVCIHDIGVEPDIVVDITPELAMKLMAAEDAEHVRELKKMTKNKVKTGEEKKEKIDSTQSKKEEDKKEEKKKDEELVDPQLQQAISLLKARDIFFKVEKSTGIK